MRETLARIDDELIDQVFQPCVDWISEHLALDCFRVARLCTDLSALAWILSQADGVVMALGSAESSPAAFRIVLLLVGLGSITVLRTLFQGSGGGKTSNRANPLRQGMQAHRFMCQFWLVGLLVKTAIAPMGAETWGFLAVGVCASLAAYFAACSNPPPKRRESMAGNGWSLATLASR